jgi:hypothetical protein
MELKEALGDIFKSAKERYDIQNTPRVILKQDEENAQGIFGKTAYYDPEDMSVVLFITNRHPKDICRSFAHELIHHVQNERGDLELGDVTSPTYAQDDKHMRKMEMEAYLKGNLLFRDWEDRIKNPKQTNEVSVNTNRSTPGPVSRRPFSTSKEEMDYYDNQGSTFYGNEGGQYNKDDSALRGIRN